MSDSQKSRPHHSEPTKASNSDRALDAEAESAVVYKPQKPSANVNKDTTPDPLETIDAPRRENNPGSEEMEATFAEQDRRRQSLPKEFGRYRIKKALGAGGMGSVYLAHDTQLDREVALKVPSFASDDPTMIERFYREARAAATMDHPHLCPVYDVGVIDGTHFLTMAYIRGKTLSAVVRKGGLPARQVAALIRKIALALHEAHEKGVIHRDLKPDNIMINSRRQPVVMDFGLAQRADAGDPRITRANAFVGTPAYMSPEQISDPSSVGPASDIFSLGIITYELLVGQRPFGGEDVMSTIGAILTKEPEAASNWSVELDPEIEMICLRALEKNAKDRYASMKEFADALGEYLTGNRGTSSDQSDDLIAVGPNLSRAPGEETLVQEMLKGITVSSASQVTTRRSIKQKRSNQAPWIVVGVLVSLVLLVSWLALRDRSGPTAVSTKASNGRPIIVSSPQADDRAMNDREPANSSSNRSLLAPTAEAVTGDNEPPAATLMGDIRASDLDDLHKEANDVVSQTPEPETDLQTPSATRLDSVVSKNEDVIAEVRSDGVAEEPKADPVEAMEDVATSQVAEPATPSRRQPVKLPTSLFRGLIAHFPLDETEGNEAVNAVPRQPGAVYVGPTEPIWVPGVVDNAVHLSDGYFDCGNNINPTHFNAFSLGCWYHSDGPQFAALIAKTDEESSYRGFELYLRRVDPRQPNNPLSEQLSIHLIHRYANLIERTVEIGSLERGWHHAFATYDGSSKAQGVRLYLDGRLVGVIMEDSLSGTLQNNVSLFIGRRSLKDQYRGRIDDVRIYNRSLRPQEVEQLYQYGVQSVESIPADERTADQTDLIQRSKGEGETGTGTE